ncbi:MULTISPECIES: acyl-CoA dehydrogenase C-terminal domain-containing protein [Methylobacterium]|uniref:Acyl-CoA dehydrogenase C-terminal domain-containing protein n=1 Tax=Methylobacterium longum TaxID=767694 RepID=A0ABT8AQJ0_9HYPH|nr:MULTISPECIES: acyl-CoA dehydrogenase C-terminal domain-containing protein [Methylobacterium]MCJ2097215.1 acyl-CoA dehydrogenase C-terminal domain-containing protein [Methylobacterium sp. E-046]MDN3571826.1 acyl-CoA dehydrogenase C-terminal domain-containing protein [Methylobacterium longum]GJE15053.1 3-methylmercaptopropionyl-CoA dehydrogenase [Methylobacterium longum]
MQTYKAPLRDMRFVLHELHADPEAPVLPGLEDFTPDVADAILEEAAKFCTERLLPLNASGDAEGCHFENGAVRTPKGFPEAYRAFREGGWTAMGADPAYGGQGLPAGINKLVEEMICSTNLSFGLYPGLSHGAYRALADHASEDLKAAYLPKLVDGTWSGTMCLTEAHCGTDLGLLRTRAVPQEDGSFKVTGSKIFISAGDHDLTENIIHLVLARLPDAPKGVKGISLFLVPKFLPRADGAPGERNGVTCSALEHKMGIKASATCQMSFDDATGWLVGEPHKGMRAMFTMMNSERLSVGIQGLGAGEAAYQGAVAYARERLQGRSLVGTKRPDLPADPIIAHPDVRRMLMTIRAYNEGCRALGAWVARSLDALERHPDPAERRRAEDFAALMTPVVKALFTDLGFEAASIGLQVYGGHGFIRDHGMEQYVRDARISMIYEGTNGVQALDLVGRKLPAHAGRLLRSFFHPVLAFLDAAIEDDDLSPLAEPLAKAFGALQLATAHIARRGLKDPEEAGAAATEYLRLFGLVALGTMWLRAAKIAQAALRAGTDERDFYEAKLVTARFYMERILPQVAGLLTAVKAGKGAMMALDEAMF